MDVQREKNEEVKLTLEGGRIKSKNNLYMNYLRNKKSILKDMN